MAVVAGYGLFEYLNQPYDLDRDELDSHMEEGLNRGLQVFEDTYNSFVDASDQLYGEVTEFPTTRQNLPYIYNRFDEYDFWGASLYRQTERLIWKGFDLSPVPVALSGTESDSLRVSVLKRNNVVYLFGQRSFYADEEMYQLLTAQRLELSPNLPFAEKAGYRLSDHPDLTGHYPVHFNFFDPFPEGVEYRKLSIESADSVGVVYASHEDRSQFVNSLNLRTSEWRAFFHVILFFTAIFLLIVWSVHSRTIPAYLFQCSVMVIGWLLLHDYGIIERWEAWIIEHPDLVIEPITVSALVHYAFHTLLFLLLFIFTFNFLRTRFVHTGTGFRFRTMLLSAVFGLLSVFLLLIYIFSTQDILVQSNLALLDLELAPDVHTFFFYITSAAFFIAISGIIISCGYYLFRKEHDKSIVISLTSFFSFILFFYLGDLFLGLQALLSWKFLLSTSLFLLFLGMIHAINKNPDAVKQMSGFRKMMIGVILASLSTYVMIWNSSNARMDRELLERANAFASEEVADTEDLVFSLLTDLENRLSTLTGDDLENRSAVTQTQFQRAVQAAIQSEWRNHSFEIQLLDTEGNLISDYSTNLDAPGWRSLVNMRLMRTSYMQQQFRRETNRPIVWDRPTDLGENYVSFNRGWIPVYDQTLPNTIIAWIFAAAYVERPDYDKPIRAVLADVSSEEWKQSYYIAEFQGERVTRTAMQGIYSNQPEYNRMPARETEIVTQDSLAFITNITAQGSFREVLLKQDENRFIKASTPIPGFNHHLFSFFRLHIVLVFFGLFLFAILAMAGLRYFSLFGQSRQFRHRLLDGLTLATILFLTFLIFATQFAVSNQNEKNVERELITKLNSLSESLRGEITLSPNQFTSTRLQEFANPLNVDAILYAGANMIDSTTPQIFQQHLISRSMPFPAYDFLYNRERRHYITTEQIGDETLLVGYRALLDENNLPAAAIAIPTFVQSPVYHEQLLETTSYLFGVYLAIFALFIISTVVFSSRLTRPLEVVQSGLNKISRGDMKARVDVKSRDEIGELARAYNLMVDRLNEARQELVLAEREAAWKEMAQQVAHEIKNPLTPMKLNLQHLQRQLEENPEDVMGLKPAIERTAANIIEQIESLNKIASDFSKFAKPVREPMQLVDLTKLIRSVADLYTHDDEVDIEVRQPRGPLTTNGIEDELRRVLINLVKNAIEAHNHPPAYIRITVQPEPEQVLIRITDRGSGIPDDDHDKIFVPNFSTKSSGTGLGLAITKKIVEAHHGEIGFETRQDEGTTFFIRLPLGG